MENCTQTLEAELTKVTEEKNVSMNYLLKVCIAMLLVHVIITNSLKKFVENYA